MKPRTVLIFSGIALLAASPSCRQEQPNPRILPGTRRVPLKIWVILGSLPSEAIGRRENAGCRLTAQEISTHITDLQEHANFFGNGTEFEWDGQLNTVIFSNLIIFDTNGNRRKNFQQFESEVIELQNNWRPAHVNIYFCGAFDSDTDANNDDFNTPSPGFNADPQASSFHYIVINDGGAYNFAGWNAHADDRILEHEMTHFMGRFKNRSFGGYTINGQSVTLTYDGEEHTPDEPVDWKLINILYGGGWPYALRIGTTEKSEISSRILQGTWANP